MRWLELPAAAALLTYEHDQELIASMVSGHPGALTLDHASEKDQARFGAAVEGFGPPGGVVARSSDRTSMWQPRPAENTGPWRPVR